MTSPAPTPTAALAPPPGQHTDFSAPDTLWQWNVLCSTACLSIPGIMFILRTYIRAWVKRVWILEDYLCCFSFIGLAVYIGILITIISKRGGAHEWDITIPDVITILYYVNIIQIWYGPAAAATKSAILLLYLRVFAVHRSSKFATTIRVFIFIICCFYFGLTIAKICQCIPRQRIWDKSVPGTCVSLPALLNASGLFNIISDVVILLVPLKGIWSLQMSRKRKIGIYAIFTVGVVAPAFSIVGLIMRINLTGSPDQSYNQPQILLWAAAELATGMMVICLPTLPGILQHRRRKPTNSIINGSGKSHGIPPHYGTKSTDEETLPSDGDYYELREGRTRNAKKPQNAFINEIRGGEEDDSYPGYWRGTRGDDNMTATGIVKSVRIEQSEA